MLRLMIAFLLVWNNLHRLVFLGDRHAKYDGIKSTKGYGYGGGGDGQALKITVKGLENKKDDLKDEGLSSSVNNPAIEEVGLDG